MGQKYLDDIKTFVAKQVEDNPGMSLAIVVCEDGVLSAGVTVNKYHREQVKEVFEDMTKDLEKEIKNDNKSFFGEAPLRKDVTDNEEEDLEES